MKRGMTPAEALKIAEALEEEAQDLRVWADEHRNPGLLPDEEGYVPPPRDPLAGCMHGWC